MSEIKISDYTYFLPQDRIALHPLADRDRSKLLVYDKGAITHSTFGNFPSYIPQDATLYFNNSKVIQARLHFTKDSGASIEVFLLNPVLPSSLLLQVMQSTERCSWSCTIGNLKRWKEGTALKKNVGAIVLQAMLKDKEHGTVEFSWTTGKTFAEVIESAGETPLPPYLKREPVPEDKERYQTVYSRIEGAVAAPTAGLHFTAPVFQELERRNIRTQFLTLHVSAGTFLPVKTEIATQHTMHQEQMVVTRENILALRDDVFTVAVGTTSMRTIESLYWFGAKLQDDDSAE